MGCLAGRLVAQVSSVPPEAKALSGAAASGAPAHRLEVWGTAGSGFLGCALSLLAPHSIPWLGPYGGGSFCPQDENLYDPATMLAAALGCQAEACCRVQTCSSN